MNWLLAFISNLGGAIAEKLFSAITAWYNEEQAASNSYEAKARKLQMESMKNGIELQKRIVKAAQTTNTIPSPSVWNAAGIVLCCFLITGCFRFYVSAREYRPIIPSPDRPILSGGDQFTHEDGQKLADYATKLETSIKTYNEWAEKSNKQAGFSD